MITEYKEGQPVTILLDSKKVVGRNGRTVGDFDPARSKTGVLINSFGDQHARLRMVEVKLDAPNTGALWLIPAAVSEVTQ